MIVGIDPGLTGALAMLSDGVASLHDMPVMARETGKGQEVNAYVLADMLRDAQPERVILERVHAMPGQGVSSVYSFGYSTGQIVGVVSALGIPLTTVSPAKWKRTAGLTGRDKDAARTHAIRLYPQLSEQLNRKKDVGRADALLIAHYGALQ